MRASKFARLATAALALVAWGGLLLQYWLLVQKLGIALGSWRFVGFFTILSNMGVALIATAVCMGRNGGLAGSRASLMGLTAIAVVGIIYSLRCGTQPGCKSSRM